MPLATRSNQIRQPNFIVDFYVNARNFINVGIYEAEINVVGSFH